MAIDFVFVLKIFGDLGCYVRYTDTMALSDMITAGDIEDEHGATGDGCGDACWDKVPGPMGQVSERSYAQAV